MKWLREIKDQLQAMNERDSKAVAVVEAVEAAVSATKPAAAVALPHGLRTVDIAGAIAKPIPTADSETQRYLELARSAGLTGVVSEVEKSIEREVQAVNVYNKSAALRLFLSENGITVYEAGTVERYMGRITPAGHRWHWVVATMGAAVEYPTINGMKAPMYSKPIPDAVILTIQKIRDAFPTSVFQVTDISQIPKGDPFLRVSLEEAGSWSGWSTGFGDINMQFDPQESFIIERWDEPGFRM